MREREEVLLEFGSSQCIIGDDCKNAHCRVEHAMADEIVRLREALAAATRVRVLDEWRVTDKDGILIATFRTEADANRYRVGLDDDDEAWPQYAPHRVVRVALVEVDDV
jgi:hypothetical protein